MVAIWSSSINAIVPTTSEVTKTTSSLTLMRLTGPPTPRSDMVVRSPFSSMRPTSLPSVSVNQIPSDVGAIAPTPPAMSESSVRLTDPSRVR